MITMTWANLILVAILVIASAYLIGYWQGSTKTIEIYDKKMAEINARYERK